MTTLTTVPAAPPLNSTPAPARIWRVVRLQLTNKWNTIWLPSIVLGAIFLMNYAIWIIILQTSASHAKDLEGTEYSGSTFFIFVYMLIVAVQAISLTFPFALGYGVTRRDYYLGSSLTWLILSAGITLVFTLLSYIEEWTGGWGLGGHFFTAVYFSGGGLFTRLFTLFAMFLFFFFVGTMSATIHVRWKMTGMLTAGLIVAIILVGLVALVTFAHGWAAVGSWFATAGPTGVVAWSLVLTAFAAVVGYFVLQRATPSR